MNYYVTINAIYCMSKNSDKFMDAINITITAKAYENIKADFNKCNMSSAVQCRAGKMLNSMLEKLVILQGFKKLEWWEVSRVGDGNECDV